MLFDFDFEYECPYCHEKYLGEHDADNETMEQTVICDECGGKFSIKTKATIDINVESTKIKEGEKEDD